MSCIFHPELNPATKDARMSGGTWALSGNPPGTGSRVPAMSCVPTSAWSIQATPTIWLG